MSGRSSSRPVTEAASAATGRRRSPRWPAARCSRRASSGSTSPTGSTRSWSPLRRGGRSRRSCSPRSSSRRRSSPSSPAARHGRRPCEPRLAEVPARRAGRPRPRRGAATPRRTTSSSACSRPLGEGFDGAVPALPVSDTLKRARGGTRHRRRSTGAVSSRCRRRRRSRSACCGPRTRRSGADATDCASLVERAGGRVRVVEGDPRLLKVTTPSDLAARRASARARSDGRPSRLLRRRRDARRRDERCWSEIADAVGMPRFTFLGVLGGAGRARRDTLAGLRLARRASGRRVRASATRICTPTSAGCLACATRDGGYLLGAVGNTGVERGTAARRARRRRRLVGGAGESRSPPPRSSTGIVAEAGLRGRRGRVRRRPCRQRRRAGAGSRDGRRSRPARAMGLPATTPPESAIRVDVARRASRCAGAIGSAR